MFIQTEQTPNPSTLKFLPGRVVMEKGTADFANVEAATPSPLAKRLFAVEGVERVFFGSDFVTVTKTADRDWQIMKPSILGGIMEHYTSGDPVIAERRGVAASVAADDDEVVAQIKELARHARPARGGPGRRRYRFSRLPRWRGLPAHAGLVLGLPEFDGHAEDGD